jgi:signal peptidase I
MRTRLAAPLAFALLLSALGCAGKVFTDPSSSMEPTLLRGEKFVARMQPFHPARGDLVLFEHDRLLLVKRVIGVAGDTVEGHDLQVFVNGALQHEPYVEHIGPRPLGRKTLETFGPLKIPAGQLFVMGDNRDYSRDSRDPRFGLIAVSDVKGKPLEIVQSPDSRRLHTKLR